MIQIDVEHVKQRCRKEDDDNEQNRQRNQMENYERNVSKHKRSMTSQLDVAHEKAPKFQVKKSYEEEYETLKTRKANHPPQRMFG